MTEPAPSPQPPASSRWISRLIRLGAVLALAGGFYVFHGSLLPPVARWLNVGEAPRETDYVLPLAGGYDTRPFVAAALMKAGYSSQALVTRVVPSSAQREGKYPHSHEIVQGVLLARGVDPESVEVLEGLCATTFDEARAVRKKLTAEPKVTVTVVTTAYHTRRARLVFRSVLGKDADRVFFVAAPHDGFDDANWWRSKSGFVTHAKEYSKYVYYLFRYGSGLYWTGFALIVLCMLWCFNRFGRSMEST
ncbi:MAG: YdcF family protein [Planctomycetales bacterium]